MKATPFTTLLSQAYVFAPEPVSVTDAPAQTVWLVPASVVGKGLTVTVTTSVLVQRLACVPVNV